MTCTCARSYLPEGVEEGHAPHFIFQTKQSQTVSLSNVRDTAFHGC